MAGRIFAGLFALALIGFYVFGFVFPEQFSLWTKDPSLPVSILQYFLGLLVIVSVLATLVLVWLALIEGALGDGAGAVYLVSFIIAWVILVFSPLSLSWSWDSAFEIFLVGGLLSPGVLAMLYAIWPGAFGAKNGVNVT